MNLLPIFMVFSLYNQCYIYTLENAFILDLSGGGYAYRYSSNI